MKPTVVIHTNDKQMLGALVSAHSFRRNSREPDSFDVRMLKTSEYPELNKPGRSILRDGHERVGQIGRTRRNAYRHQHVHQHDE